MSKKHSQLPILDFLDFIMFIYSIKTIINYEKKRKLLD